MTQLQEAEYGLTDIAMNPSRFQGDEFLLVKFYMHPRYMTGKSEQSGRPVYEETEYLQIMKPGDRDNVIQRPATKMDKQRFAEHYRKFKAREDQESFEGTLLEEWPAITRSQAEELKFLNIRTVEQLANVADNYAQNIMGVNVLKSKAKAFIEAADKNATNEALADANAQIEELRQQIAAMRTEPVEEVVEEVEEVEEEYEE
jgi:Zn-dependent metalloprotease